MATAQYVQNGKSIDYTPGADVSAGDVVVQGDLVGIAKIDIEGGQLGALAVVGIFDVPKATGVGEAIAVGAKLYWDEVNSQATTSDGTGTNKYMGKCILAAGDDDTAVRTRLDQ